jgi:hypothetical protein
MGSYAAELEAGGNQLKAVEAKALAGRNKIDFFGNIV